MEVGVAFGADVCVRDANGVTVCIRAISVERFMKFTELWIRKARPPPVLRKWSLRTRL